jgi:hypothetical protein
VAEDNAQCPWSIRWTFGTDAACEKPEHIPPDMPPEAMHEDEFTHQAHVGLEGATLLTWYAGDRREFTGRWLGPCVKLAGCTLHTGHHGRCAP